MGAIVAGCGEDTTEVELGEGTIEVPNKAFDEGPKARAKAVIAASLDGAGYVESVKDCYLSELEQLPADRFREIDQLDGAEKDSAQLQLGIEAGSNCIRSGDNIIRDDASPEQVSVFRTLQARQFRTLLKTEGVPARATNCIVRFFEGLSDDDLVRFANAVVRQQRRQAIAWGRACAE